MDANLEQMAGPQITGKTQEFIDHTFLAPTYIMDLIDEHQFPKTVVEVQAEPIADAYSLKDALPSDINFPNSLFQFVQQKADAHATAGSMLGTVKSNGATTSAATNPADFITLNGDFLGANQRGVEASVSSGVAEFNALALPADLSVTLEDSQGVLTDPDVLYNRVSSRKILPHKKRISRKLKGSGAGAIGNGPESPSALPTSSVVVERLHNDCAMRYSCELCGCQASTQLDFFAHLKQHYEPPSTPDTILAAMKTSLDSLEPDKHFVDFPSEVVTSPVVAQVLHGTVTHADDMKVLAATNMQKCMNFVTPSGDTSSLKSMQVVDEVEFSDTEDMLEGIRNVVDKVSIEDDDIELMNVANGMRAASAWFTNETLNGLEFNKKNYGDLTFAAALEEGAPNHNAAALCCDGADAAVRESEVVTKTENDDGDTYTQDFKNFNGSDSQNGYTDVYDSVVDEIADNNADDDDNDDDLDDEDDDDDDGGGGDADFDDTLQEYMDSPSKVSRRRKEQKGTDEPQHFCTQCQRGFNSKNALKYHTRTHNGIRPHQCDVCGKSFFAVGALKSHIRTHTGDKPYECTECKRKFRQYADLKYHLTSLHSEEKSYQCEFCGKAFSRKYSLVLHRRIHTSEKNYKCEHCGKAFIASVYLQSHRKIHTGEKPYECEVCSKKFRVWGDLSRHRQIHERHKQKSSQQKRTSSTRNSLKLIETIECRKAKIS